MTRLTHSSAPGTRRGSRTRRFLGGLGQRVRVAAVRGGLGPLDASSGLGTPVLRDYPYRVDR